MSKVKKISKQTDWIKVWSGRWSFLFDSYQCFWWTNNKVFQKRAAFKKVVYFYRNGITDSWVRASDKDDFGRRMMDSSRKNPKYFSDIAKKLISNGERVKRFLATHSYKNLKLKDYDAYWQILGEYFNYHINVKYVVDYLSAKQMEKYLPVLENARLVTELVPRQAEDFMQNVAYSIAKKSGYSKEQILCTVREELREYFVSQKLPSVSELKKRYTGGTLLFDKLLYNIYVGKKSAQIKKLIESVKDAKKIKGQIAHKGVVRGKVKIIFNPLKEGKNFAEGEILVTGMTRPEFLPIMHKAAAFVTDAGGILSHAAITAREMKKPCIIGTKIATKVFKDGDIVEVNANTGVVKLIKQK